MSSESFVPTMGFDSDLLPLNQEIGEAVQESGEKQRQRDFKRLREWKREGESKQRTSEYFSSNNFANVLAR
jgi:hypothetical protein